jgi:hypothetical protein
MVVQPGELTEVDRFPLIESVPEAAFDSCEDGCW